MPPRIERAPLARRVENALLLLRVTVLVQLLLENPLRLVCLPVKFTLAFRIELRQNPGACRILHTSCSRAAVIWTSPLTPAQLPRGPSAAPAVASETKSQPPKRPKWPTR